MLALQIANVDQPSEMTLTSNLLEMNSAKLEQEENQLS